MATIRIRYLTTRPGKSGTLRHYWQPRSEAQKAGWKVQRLSNDFDEAMRQAEKLNDELDAWRAGAGVAPTNAKIGTVEALINHYKNNWRFKDKKPKTRHGYEYVFRILNRLIGDVPVAAISPKSIQKIYVGMRVEHPAKANAVIRVLRLLMEHARREDMIKVNPAARPGLQNNAKKGALWNAEFIQHFVQTADAMGRFEIGTAVLLNEWIGQRKGDIMAMPLSAYRDGALHLKQNKTGAQVVLPVNIIAVLKDRLELQIARNEKIDPTPNVLIPAASGMPWSEFHFTHVFTSIRNKAAETMPEMKDMVFKDLRHTAVTRLAEAGCEIPEIASITGHSFRTCEEIIDRYNVRTTKMARNAFNKRQAAEDLIQQLLTTTEGNNDE